MPDQEQNQVEGQEQSSTQESGTTEVSGSLLTRFEREIEAVVERYHTMGLLHDEIYDALEEAKDNIPDDPEEEDDKDKDDD